eukprot:GHVS01103172.1.p1 GENE.GHVS01103172.1~~GHVS01103172.1.p1  ORF type:complete len:379 (+),score=62.50 GHVS01103172.1:211-1347(+)
MAATTSSSSSVPFSSISSSTPLSACDSTTAGPVASSPSPVSHSPLVTHFDQPQTVSFGKSRPITHTPTSTHSDSISPTNYSPGPSPSSSGAPIHVPSVSSLLLNGRACSISSSPSHFLYIWSQSRYDVSVSFFLPPLTKGKQVSMTVSESSLSFRIRSLPKGSSSFAFDPPTDSGCKEVDSLLEFAGAWRHEVDANEDNWMWEMVELPYCWEELQQGDPYCSSSVTNVAPASTTATSGIVNSGTTPFSALPAPTTAPSAIFGDANANSPANSSASSTRVLKLSVKKKQKIADAFIWWDSAFKGHSSIDVGLIAERNLIHGEQREDKSGGEQQTVEKVPESALGSSNENTKFIRAWDEAHKQFTRQVKEQKQGKRICLD